MTDPTGQIRLKRLLPPEWIITTATAVSEAREIVGSAVQTLEIQNGRHESISVAATLLKWSIQTQLNHSVAGTNVYIRVQPPLIYAAGVAASFAIGVWLLFLSLEIGVGRVLPGLVRTSVAFASLATIAWRGAHRRFQSIASTLPHGS